MENKASSALHENAVAGYQMILKAAGSMSLRLSRISE
jgi:hypothetical protein